jgi:hypothetical protein
MGAAARSGESNAGAFDPDSAAGRIVVFARTTHKRQAAILPLPQAIQGFTSLYFAAAMTRLCQRSARKPECRRVDVRPVLPLPKGAMNEPLWEE